MANIAEELSIIKSGVYGKDIRNAIHDAIKKVNDEGGSGGSGRMNFSTFTDTMNKIGSINYPVEESK